MLERAREVLSKLERYELDVFAETVGGGAAAVAFAPEARGESGAGGEDALSRAASRAGRRALAAQVTLFDAANQDILDELRGVDVETVSTEEARQILLDLKRRMV